MNYYKHPIIIVFLLVLPLLVHAGEGMSGGSLADAMKSLGASMPVPANISDIKNNCSALKTSGEQLLQAVKNTASKSSVEQNGNNALHNLQSSLESLTGTLNSDEDISVDDLTNLISNAKSVLSSSLSSMKDDELKEGTELKAKFDAFQEQLEGTAERIKDVFSSGLYYTTPVRFSKDFKNWGFELSFDSLKMEQGDNPNSVSDDRTSFSASVQLQLPFLNSANDGNIIKFGGRDVKLKGGAESLSRIYLESKPRKKINENMYLSFLDEIPDAEKGKIQCAQGDRSWVEFNCHGVTAFNLVCCMSFKKTFIRAVEPAKDVTDGSTAPVEEKEDSVKAYFVIGSEGGALAKVCFNSPFKVVGCGNFVFTVKDAMVDLSSEKNLPGFAFPTTDYWDEEISDAGWTGFFMDEMDVEFPKEFKLNKNQENGKTEVVMSKILIDHYGFSGTTLIKNLLNTMDAPDGGKIKHSGLQMALDTLMMAFLKSRPIDGLISGRARANFIQKKGESSVSKKSKVGPPMGGYEFALRGSVGYNKALDKYIYDIKATFNTTDTFDVPFAPVAHIAVKKGAYVEFYNNEARNFAAKLHMSGSFFIDWTLKLKGVEYEDLQICSESPHVTCSQFALIGNADLMYGGMGIQLKKLGWLNSDYVLPKLNDSNITDAAGIRLDARISLIPGDNTLATEFGGDIMAGYDGNWRFKKFAVRKICLDAKFAAFAFNGCVEWFDEDANWGDGFSGNIKLTLLPLQFGIEGTAIFGHKGGCNYWLVRAEADFSGFPVLIFPPCVFMKSAMGGAYHHLNRKKRIPYNESTGDVDWASLEIIPDNYQPDEGTGMGFLLGIGIYAAQKNVVSGNAVLDIGFNPNWGLDHISLIGKATVLGEMEFIQKLADLSNSLSVVISQDKKDEFNKKYNNTEGVFGGKLYATFTPKDKTFLIALDLNADLAGVITGHAKASVFFNPNKWHFWLGTRDEPIRLSFLKDIFLAETYFMLGEVPKTLIPLDKELAKQFDIFQVDKNNIPDSEIGYGKGMAFGARLKLDADVGLPLKIVWAGFDASVGADLLVGPGSCGKVKWRGQGDVYATLSAKVGATVPLIFTKLQFKIFRGGALALLVGKLPSPFYGYADIGFDCNIIYIPLPKIHIKVKLGHDC
ncbi:MAG: hypothetical protein J5875_02710 [Paludibacteraceae bacterium]|nr:hypothetical protein [Paludibacteraceae bacterium]